MTKKDYYKVLGVSKDATADQIKKAYRKLAQQHHPDTSAGDEAKFKEINEAYEVLSDQKKRSQYDQFGQAGFNQQQGFGQGFGGANFEGFDFSDMFRGEGLGDIFDTFFGGGGRQQRGPVRGADLETRLTLNFEDAFFGKEQEVEVEHLEKCPVCKGNKAEPGTKIVTCSECGGTGEVKHVRRTPLGQFAQVGVCPKCQGEGKLAEKLCHNCHGEGKVRVNKKIKIKIPAGVDNGSVIKMSGQGDIGDKGGSVGDLYIGINILPHKVFKRESDNVLIDVPISFSQAALGDKIEVPTIDGKVNLNIPSGTQPDQTFVLKGKGIPHLQRAGRGDQLVTVKVKVPTRLSSRERQLLEELAKESKNESFFDKFRKNFN